MLFTFWNHSNAFCGTLNLRASWSTSSISEGKTLSKAARDVFTAIVLTGVCLPEHSVTVRSRERTCVFVDHPSLNFSALIGLEIGI